MNVKTESILIIDDEPLAREMMREVLNREGYHVFAVGSADEALRQAENEHFDLVLADIVMPCNGGLEMVEELREVSPDTTLLMIGSYPNIETARAAMRVGVYDCIVNPFEHSELRAAIAKAVRRRRLIEEALRRRRFIKEAQPRRQLIEEDSLLKRLVEPIRNKRAPRTASSSNT
ncbi:MAG: response regulator [Chloroflexi bacterium]|jgi:DNA-binding NtrC family response regulator|nr:response regulator [Chloroflexota bacterium]